MKDVLEALRGAKLIGELAVVGEGIIRHYLLKSGQILEVILRQA